ncbi:RND family transporter, partial [candidate division KSB1 bacterium]
RIERKIISYFEWILNRRLITLLSILLGIFCLGYGLRYLNYSIDYRSFFSEDYPQLKAFEKLQNIYTKNDNILIVIEPKSRNVFTPVFMDLLESLTQESWQIPYTIRVDAITNFQHTVVLDDELIVEDLVSNAQSKTLAELEDIRKIVINEPLLVNRLVSSSGHVTGINVTMHLPGKSIDEVPETVRATRGLVKKYMEEYPDVEIYLTGTIMLDNAFSEGVLQDMKVLIPLMYVVIILLIYFLLRSISCTIIIIVLVGFSIVGAMGFAGWAGIRLSPASASAPTMVMTLAIADSIHILLSMLREMKKGHSKRDSIIKSLKINIKPVFLTSFTTCIGFLTLNFSESPPFHDLGNITAFGVLTAFLLSILFLPSIVLLLPIRYRKSVAGNIPFLDFLPEIVIKYRRYIFIGSIFFIILMTALIPRNELNDQFIDYFDEDVKFRVDTDFTMENLTGIYYMGFSLSSGESGGINDPGYLEKLDEFARWLKNDRRIKQVITLSDLIKRLNRTLNNNDPAFYNIPESRGLTAQYLLLYELSLPYGQDLNNIINVDKSASRFTVTLGDVTTNEIREIAEGAEKWLRDNAPGSMYSTAAGTSVMFAHIFDKNIKGMLLGTTIALIVISLLLLAAFRSIKFGIISLIPNLVPGVIAFGIWGGLVGRVGLALSGVTAISLGIIVDDTVHFLNKYLIARKRKEFTPEDSVRYAFATVGRELVITSIILIGGFSILLFSSFKINSDMGTLTAITIAVALIADFLILPSLLLTIDKNNTNSKTISRN